MSETPQRPAVGVQRQFEIYLAGAKGQRPSQPISIDELERKAAEVLSPGAYGYVAGGAGGEDTLRANRAAFGRWRLERAQDAPSGLFTLLFRRTSAGWRIVHDHTSAAELPTTSGKAGGMK